MPQKLRWTPEQDGALLRARAAGAAWDAIAESLAVSRNAAIERGRTLGARLPIPERRPAPEDPHRPPLPPGHPASWGALIAGTALAGTAYPWPIPGVPAG